MLVITSPPPRSLPRYCTDTQHARNNYNPSLLAAAVSLARLTKVEVSRALNLVHLTASTNGHHFPLLRYLKKKCTFYCIKLYKIITNINCRVLPVDRFGYLTAKAARLRSPVSNPDLLLSVFHRISSSPSPRRSIAKHILSHSDLHIKNN
ncbi:hypothetical protein E2C01_097310 [Portunus trituberculatus]|uniref:Uncharacterized protein n=1 Tax=Portunus trituberculatus TaxID=210409 RepID=A0A5B7K5D9_PORTR|nr:hypothetical protein [Portunus trituberculatus]